MKFNAEELNLVALAQQYSDKKKARAFLESLMWPDGPECPHCRKDGSECKDVYKLVPKKGSKNPARDGVYMGPTGLKFGRYDFSIESGGKQIATTPLYITQGKVSRPS